LLSVGYFRCCLGLSSTLDPHKRAGTHIFPICALIRSCRIAVNYMWLLPGPFMRKVFLFLLLSCCVFSCWATTEEGHYSSLAVAVSDLAVRTHGLVSPNGESTLHVGHDQSVDCCFPYRVWLSHKGKRYSLSFGTYTDAEVVWAPDSSAFFVTYSDGGAVGTFHVLVYTIDDSGPHRSEPIPNGRKLLKPHCRTPEYPNVGGIGWGEDSHTLVIGVEVPPHS
jgi:hypothetical protein